MTNDLWHLVERLTALADSGLRHQATAHGLQGIHLQILSYLANANRYSDTLTALVDYLGCTKGTVSQSVAVLHERGLIEREEDPADRRKSHLRVTTAGRRLLTTCLAEHPLRVACADQPEATSDQLRALLLACQRRNGGRAFGICNGCRFHLQEGRQRRCGLTGERLSDHEAALRCREFEALAP